MDPYLNIKPTASPTLFYNGTRSGGGFWATWCTIPCSSISIILSIYVCLCNFIKLKYCQIRVGFLVIRLKHNIIPEEHLLELNQLQLFNN